MRTASGVASHLFLALFAAAGSGLVWHVVAGPGPNFGELWAISGVLAAALAVEHLRYASLAGSGRRAPRWFTRGSWLAVAGVTTFVAATHLAPSLGLAPSLALGLTAVLAVAVAFVAATMAAVAGLARLDSGARRA
jgi:hypothetical protein